MFPCFVMHHQSVVCDPSVWKIIQKGPARGGHGQPSDAQTDGLFNHSLSRCLKLTDAMKRKAESILLSEAWRCHLLEHRGHAGGHGWACANIHKHTLAFVHLIARQPNSERKIRVLEMASLYQTSQSKTVIVFFFKVVLGLGVRVRIRNPYQ